MAAAVGHLSKLQQELYREKHGFDKLSRNFQSAPVHDPSNFRRITTYPDRYSRHLEQADIHVKCPWGRARSYAGEAPVYLPDNHRPKWEPPAFLQKGHRHYGSGVTPHPRGLPLQQFYNLTQLKRSKVRWNDELAIRTKQRCRMLHGGTTQPAEKTRLAVCDDLDIWTELPRPTTADVQEGQIVLPFPKESSLSSHMSRQAMFPKPQRTEYDFQNNISSPTPPPIIINKAMGSFARREVVTPMMNSRTTPPPTQQVRPVLATNNWFSKHEVTRQFNKLNPSTTPTIRLNIQRRRCADWQLVS